LHINNYKIEGSRLDPGFLSFEEVFQRFLRSGFDSVVYKTMLEAYHKKPEVDLHLREYNAAARSQAIELLEECAKELADYNLPKYKDYTWQGILVEKIVDAVNPKWKNIIFGHCDSEDRLYPVIRRFLKREYDAVYPTYDKKREGWPDFFCLKKGWLGGIKTTVAVDAKVDYGQFKRFLDQATNFMKYADYVFLATTPGLVIEIGEKNRSAVWGESILREKLESVDIGYIIVDMTSGEVVTTKGGEKSSYLDKEEKERRLRMLGVRSS